MDDDNDDGEEALIAWAHRTRLLNPADRECSPEVYIDDRAARLAVALERRIAQVARLAAELAAAQRDEAGPGDLPKLIRDGVPDEIRGRGGMPRVRALARDERLTWLLRKLREEAAEVEKSPSDEELADVLEVAFAIAHAIGSTGDAIERRRLAKWCRLGGFDRGLVLEAVEEPAI